MKQLKYMQLNSCPICEESSFTNIFKATYFRGEKEKFQIQECDSCNLWFTNPRPSDEEIGAYYESEDYVSHTDKKESLVDKVYHIVRGFAVKKKVALVNKYAQSGRLLDYGAGTGFFLSKAKDSNWNVMGLEPSEVARENAKTTHGLDLNSPFGYNWKQIEGSLNCITLWHVMEHLTDLKGDFKNFTNSLQKGGNLIIAVPNHESHDADVYRNDWAALDVPLHLYHFAKSNVKDLADQFGFDLVTIKNMPFDAYYVSMLSEKNKNGKNNFLRAIWNGFRSNLKAKGKSNASSLIYVLKKR